MKKILLTFLTFLCFETILSQSDFRTGFIINKTNDTLRGYIDYSIASSKYQKISFKSSLTSKEKNYSPKDILGYGYHDNELFTSKYIEDKKYNETYFIENLILGRLSLYKLFDEYFVSKGDNFARLDNDKVILTKEGVNYESKNKRYINVLKYLIADCNLFRDNMLEINYSQIKLVNLLKIYNKCANSEAIIYKKNKDWFKTSFGGFLGVSNTSLKNERENYNAPFLDNLNTTSSYITYGAFIEFSFPRIIEKISLYTGIIFNSFDYYNYEIINNNLLENKGNIKQLNIPIAIRYHFTKKKYTPYITAGIINSINLDNQSNWNIENKNSNRIVTSLEPFSVTLNTVGLISGIGLQRKINEKTYGFLEVNYQYLNTTNSPKERGNSFDTTNGTFQILIGLKL
jgi:hypothetical protein